jgi:hypothetical protein
MKYLKLINDIIIDQLVDLKSLRYLLVIAGFVFNIWIINLVAFHNLHYSIAITSIGLLSLIFTYFFASKNKQAEMENQIKIANGDPPTNREDI